MKASTKALPFRKTATCPASSTLLSLRAGGLSVELTTTVREHLAVCDFCCAEFVLLGHHQPVARAPKTPEMPINLRILAESILAK